MPRRMGRRRRQLLRKAVLESWAAVHRFNNRRREIPMRGLPPPSRSHRRPAVFTSALRPAAGDAPFEPLALPTGVVSLPPGWSARDHSLLFRSSRNFGGGASPVGRAPALIAAFDFDDCLVHRHSKTRNTWQVRARFSANVVQSLNPYVRWRMRACLRGCRRCTPRPSA